MRTVVVSLFVRWALLALAFAITSWILQGMEISGGFWAYIWVSAIFGIVNAIIGTLLRALTFPLTVLTLGLFSVLVNALLLAVTDGLTSHLTIDQFWWTATWAAIVLSAVSVLLDLAVAMVWRPRPAPV